MYNICMGHSSFVGGEQANMRSNPMCVIARPPNVQVSCLCHLRFAKSGFPKVNLPQKTQVISIQCQLLGCPILAKTVGGVAHKIPAKSGCWILRLPEKAQCTSSSAEQLPSS